MALQRLVALVAGKWRATEPVVVSAGAASGGMVPALDPAGRLDKSVLPGRSYTFQQATPSAVWVIGHNLGYFPSVTVLDSTGREVQGDVAYLDSNNIRVSFSAGFSGVAYLN